MSKIKAYLVDDLPVRGKGQITGGNGKEHEAGYNISWGSILAGVVTFFALFITLSLIGSAIGFGGVTLTANNPLEGVGLPLILWTVLSLILSFLGAGFISGVASRRLGLLHGFLTWATSMIALVLLLSYGAVGAFSAVGSLFGNVASVAGSGVETAASGISDAVSTAFDGVTSQISSVDTDDLQGNVKQVLKDTDVPQLQPDYLKNQLADSSTDIKNAIKDIAVNPDNADSIIDSLTTKLEDRAKTIGDNVDEDAIATAVASNTDLTKAEADEATKNITEGLKTASTKAQDQIENAKEALVDTKENLDDTIASARKTADDATNTVSKASIWGFVAMLAGLALTSFAGYKGTNYVKFDADESAL